MADNSLTYEDCKRLDEMFETSTLSPLHRSNRFPDAWRLEIWWECDECNEQISSSRFISDEHQDWCSGHPSNQVE